MLTEIYSATNLSSFTSLSSTMKTAMAAPQTKETIASVKTDILSLIAQGKIVVKDNLHTLLNTPNPIFPVSASGTAQPTVYHNLDSLNILAKKIS